MSNVVREQALSPVECDIPDRWSVDEYRQAMAIAATAPEAPSLFRRLRCMLWSPGASSAAN